MGFVHVGLHKDELEKKYNLHLCCPVLNDKKKIPEVKLIMRGEG